MSDRKTGWLAAVKGIGKVLTAGTVAVGILSLLMCFYSIRIVRVPNKMGNTDYVYPAKSVWVKATEGISFGRMDANGFNNVAVIDNPDIIVLGSSHMEAFDVMQNETAAYLLNEKLGGAYTVYNMGMGGHTFYKTSQYLHESIARFEKVPKVAIIETSNAALDREQVDQVLTHSVPVQKVYNGGVTGLLQKIPFIRMVAHQVEQGLLDVFMPTAAQMEETIPTVEENVDEKAYADLFAYFRQTEQDYGTQIILAYHPVGTICADGTQKFQKGPQYEAFARYAQEYGIRLVDLTPRFEEMYADDHHVAYGFITGRIGAGHMNAYGHAAMAEALYEELKEMEASGELCR